MIGSGPSCSASRAPLPSTSVDVVGQPVVRQRVRAAGRRSGSPACGRRASAPARRCCATARAPIRAGRPAAAPRARACVAACRAARSPRRPLAMRDDRHHHQQFEQREAASAARRARVYCQEPTSAFLPSPPGWPSAPKRHHVDLALHAGIEVLVRPAPGIVGQLLEIGLPVGRHRAARWAAPPAPAGPARRWGSAGCPGDTA